MLKKSCLVLFAILFSVLCSCSMLTLNNEPRPTLTKDEYVSQVNSKLAEIGVTSAFSQANLSDFWYGKEKYDGIYLYQCDLSANDTLYLLLYEEMEHQVDSYASLHLETYNEHEKAENTQAKNVFVALANYMCLYDVSVEDINSLTTDEAIDGKVYHVSFVGRNGISETIKEKYHTVNPTGCNVLQYETGKYYRNDDKEAVYGMELSLCCELSYKITGEQNQKAQLKIER